MQGIILFAAADAVSFEQLVSVLASFGCVTRWETGSRVTVSDGDMLTVVSERDFHTEDFDEEELQRVYDVLKCSLVREFDVEFRMSEMLRVREVLMALLRLGVFCLLNDFGLVASGAEIIVGTEKDSSWSWWDAEMLPGGKGEPEIAS